MFKQKNKGQRDKKYKMIKNKILKAIKLKCKTKINKSSS